MAKKKMVKAAGSDEFVQEEIATEQEVAQVIEQVQPKKKSDLVTLDLPVSVKVNGKRYVGRVTVSPKLAEVLAHMAHKKQKSDLRVFTGKNYNVSRLANNTLVIKEGE